MFLCESVEDVLSIGEEDAVKERMEMTMMTRLMMLTMLRMLT